MGIVIPPQMMDQMRRARDPSIAAAEYQQLFNQSSGSPIPGLTGPNVPGFGIPGMMGPPAPSPGPGLNQIPPNPMPGPMMPFQSSGPYGQQAMMLAGLLGHRQTPGIPTSGFHGLLGRGRSIPGGK